MLEWKPPPEGGRLSYIFSIDHLRDDRAYDARCAKTWAIFRGQDLVPRMRVRTTRGAVSDSVLRMRLPEGWSAALPYPRLTGGQYDLENSRTRFDRPTGWYAFGKLGVLREEFNGTRIAVVGPSGQGVRRMDALALIKWTLPSLAHVFGALPERFQLVIAGDPMWRGGLSGPRSAYLHVDRPLIGEDASSPLLHEMVHSLMHARAGKDGEWIVEGIAEYYSVALLRRSETLTTARYESAIEKINQRASPATARLDGDMTSALRARSVVILMEIDDMIRNASGGASSLDDVVRVLVSSDESITPKRLRKAMEKVAGRKYDSFFDQLPLGR
jgi:predicted metalloprotease with PDZ domain